MSETWHEGYAEEQRESHDAYFGDPSFETDEQEAEREAEDDDEG